MAIFRKHIQRSTPDTVIGEYTNNISRKWGLKSAFDALPGRLSPNRAKHAMAWGQEFLIRLSHLAGLTEDQHEEVQQRFEERIDKGRSKQSREQWVTPADLDAVIKRYTPTVSPLRGLAPTETAAGLRRSQRIKKRQREDDVENRNGGEPSGDESPEAFERKRVRVQNSQEMDNRGPGSRGNDQHVPENIITHGIGVNMHGAGGNAANEAPRNGSHEPSVVSNAARENEVVAGGSSRNGPPQSSPRHDLAAAQIQNELGARHREDQPAQVLDDVRQWISGVFVEPQDPSIIAAISDQLSELAFEQRFPIPDACTPDEEIALLEILKRRHVNHSSQETEYDYRIQLVHIQARKEAERNAVAGPARGDPER